MCPRAFAGAAHYIDPAPRAFAAIHGQPMPVTWALDAGSVRLADPRPVVLADPADRQPSVTACEGAKAAAQMALPGGRPQVRSDTWLRS